VLAALLAMRLRPQEALRVRPPLLQELRSGFAYAFGFPPIRTILLVLALTSLTGAPLMVLMPVFVKQILHGDAQSRGILMAIFGLGAVTGAIYLASRSTVLGLGLRIALAGGCLGLGMIGFSFTDSLPLALLACYVTGLAMMVEMTSSNTILQTIVDDDK